MGVTNLISVVTPTYNEEGNVAELHEQIRAVFAELPQYDYEHIYIDNASLDNTRICCAPWQPPTPK